MAFFDDIKRSASDVADKVVKKTGELTGIAKTYLSIHSSENKLNEIYKEIGFLFYTAERYGVDYTEEIAAQVLKADGLIVEIDNLRKSYAKARGLRVCVGCGNEISSDCLFCSFCGAKQEQEKNECTCSCEDEAECCCECTDEPCDCEKEDKED